MAGETTRKMSQWSENESEEANKCNRDLPEQGSQLSLSPRRSSDQFAGGSRSRWRHCPEREILEEGENTRIMKSILTFLIISFITLSSGRTLMEGECESPDDCQPGECCVLGMQRYAIPECRRLATLGEDCIEDAEPQDRMLYYPNNEFRWVLQLHTLMCPCEGNYVCHKNKCSNPFSWK